MDSNLVRRVQAFQDPDGNLIILAMSEALLGAYKVDSTGSSTVLGTYSAPTSITFTDFAVADIDGSGDADIFIATSGDDIWLNTQ